MSYIFFLKRQLFTFSLILLMIVLSSLKNGRWCLGWFSGLSAEFAIAFALTYIFGGAYVRFLMNEQEYDVLDEE